MSGLNDFDFKKIKLSDSIEQAINITENPNSIYGYMGSYSPIIGTTNENQNEIAKHINYNDKSILVTGSSADQYLSSVYFGSKEETIYDINALAEFYIFLKIAAMRNLKYDKLIELMLPFIDNQKYFNPNVIKSLLSELPPHIKEFWTIYLDSIDITKISNLILFLDNNLDSLKSKLPYYNEDSYNHLQKLLKKKDNPKFIEMDASYFEYSIKDKYDFISLSNIIECNQQPFDDVMERRLYSNEEWIEYINEVICKNLNKNGELMILQTGEWNYKPYIEAGFEKHSLEANNQINNMLILKR